MLTKADEYPIHQTPDPIAFSGTDRNFYDRYFFNGHSRDGDVFFGAAMGIYPHLNIIDAGFSVRIGEMQYNLRGSRHLNMERMDTFVGPIRIEVIEPLHSLRLIVEDNEHGICADLNYTGRHFPLEEKRTTKRIGPRTLQDLTRMTQMGRYTGWVRAGGQEISFTDAQPALGVRDRSWGVRPIGTRDPQAPVPAQEMQVWWYWLPVHFDDGVMLFFLNEDGEGKAWNQGLLTCADGGEPVHWEQSKLDVELKPGTRWPTHATVYARDEAGQNCTIAIEPGANFFMSGLGYMHPEWNHGMNKGEFALGYDEIRTAQVEIYGPPYQHAQSFAQVTVTSEDGKARRGVGAFEYIIIGRHAPSGLSSLFGVP
ncbi:MAG: hypothetical protein P8J20_15780 [Novosphingobium sp.]|nr:hypothetical protein [Novosphingobium sp.]